MTITELNLHQPIIDNLLQKGWTAKQSSWQHSKDGTTYAWDLRSPRGTDVFFTNPFTEDDVLQAEALKHASKLHAMEIRAQLERVYVTLLNDLAAVYRAKLVSPGKGLDIPEEVFINKVEIKLTREKTGETQS